MPSVPWSKGAPPTSRWPTSAGNASFFGRDFSVDASVLIPRPETEQVVEGALAWAKEHPSDTLRILDVGCGSGALAVTLAAELTHATVVAVDISEQALAKTQHNAERHGVSAKVACLRSDLCASVEGAFDIIVSNPPYIAEEERPELAADVVRYEPHIALFAADNGLQIIARLSRDVRAHLRQPGIFLCEIGYRQGDAARQLLPSDGFWQSVDVLPDLQGHPRVVVARC